MANTEHTLSPVEIMVLKQIFRPVVYMLVEDFIEEGRSKDDAWEHMLTVKPEDVNEQQEQLMSELFEEIWAELEK